MRVYKAGNKFIAIHHKGNTVYSAQGGSEEEAKNKVMEMIKKMYKITMKKIILLAFTTLMMVGCGEVNREKEYIKESEKILIIDSCEYIERGVYYGSVLVHKGNCKYCKERRKQDLKELVEQLKEK